MKLNQKLIKQLRNGEIAVENNGTLEQLREVLKEAFPEAVTPCGSGEMYFLDKKNKDDWNVSYTTNLHVVSVTDFYKPEQFTGWAKDDKIEKFMFYYKDDVQKFGFNTFGSWIEGGNVNYSEDENNRPATHEEILKHLTQEAKRIGYEGGNTIKGIHGTTHSRPEISSFYYDSTRDRLLTNDGCIVYEEGQWAEIVEKPQLIHYLVDDMKYSFSYQELKAKYEDVCQYSDEVFMNNLPEIAHLACIVCYFKGLGNNATIGDKGIIHELIHLMVDPHEPTNDLKEIREKFNSLIKLV